MREASPTPRGPIHIQTMMTASEHSFEGCMPTKRLGRNSIVLKMLWHRLNSAFQAWLVVPVRDYPSVGLGQERQLFERTES